MEGGGGEHFEEEHSEWRAQHVQNVGVGKIEALKKDGVRRDKVTQDEAREETKDR